MNNYRILFSLVFAIGGLLQLSAQDFKPARVGTATTVRTARVLTPQARLAAAASAEEKSNWGAPAGILSSTKKTPQGGRLTTSSYAKAGHAAGQTATETLRELRRGFPSLKMADLLRALMTGGYTWPEAATALRDLGNEPGPSARLLRSANAPAGEVALAMQKMYRLNGESVITILNAGGYSAEDIVGAARKELRMPADLLLKGMKYVRADMNRVLPSVTKAYGFAQTNTIRLARKVGLRPVELEKIILTTIRPVSGNQAADLLKAAEVAPDRIVKALKNQYRISVGATAKIMKNQLGLPVDEATRLLRTIYNSSANDVAKALMDGAKYNYERTKSALSSVYNMSMADVVRLLSPWH